MSDVNTPANYLLFNEENSKNPIIVVKITGAPDVLTSGPLQTRVLYGDPDLFYGDPGLVYGGLRDYAKRNEDGSLSVAVSLIDLNAGSLMLQQRVEPEQGKASVSTLTIGFIDKDEYMTRLVSPGQVLDEILLQECGVYLGFKQTSYPQDYFRIFRGYISGVTPDEGRVSIQISDANIKLRTLLFFISKTELSSGIGTTDQLITLDSNAEFFSHIIQPDGSDFNPSIRAYIQIEDEVIECEPVFQSNYGYTNFIQGITYTAQPGYGSAVSITYIGGGTAGSELVTTDSTAITVKIQSGVSTAQQVRDAIIQSEDASILVSPYVFPPSSGTTQTLQAQTFLVLNPKTIGVFNGIFYTQQDGASGVTVAYVNDTTFGAEFVTVVGTAITVHIQAGSSTAANVYSALLAAGAAVTNLTQFRLLPNAGPTIQIAYGTTPLTSQPVNRQMAVITRGARGTTPAAHDPGVDTSATIQVGDLGTPENAMDMALKLQLSGWNGPWIRNIPIKSIGVSPDPTPGDPTTDIICFPSGVDVVNDFGLVAQDIIYLYDSPNKLSNATPFRAVRFESFEGQNNRIIHIDRKITKEASTVATASFRSQYDQYPVNAGMSLTPKDVDVAQHQYIKGTFLGAGGNNLLFYIINQEDSGKDFIQTEVYFPIGAYGITRYGKLSCSYNSPPIANQNVVTFDETNILNPQQLNVQRAANNRTLFNQIDLNYAPTDDGQTFTKKKSFANTDSIRKMGGFTNVLPINARGIDATYPEALLNKYGLFLLNRYAFGTTIIPAKINWQAGSVTEVGDVSILDDSKGILQISNFQTGKRGLGKQLFNIIDRTFSIKDGTVDVRLQGNLGATVNDRFATISPSSKVGVGSTTTEIIIVDSYGALYPGNESKKWEKYLGLPITVHSFDYSVSADVILNSIDPVNNYMLHVDALPFTPTAGYIVDIQNFPNNPDPTVNEFYKTMHAFLDPTVFVVTGIDSRNFTVSGGDASKFFVGSVIRMHNADYSIDSGEVLVSLIVGTQITVDNPLGFTPTAGLQIDLIGFPDKSQPYRFI